MYVCICNALNEKDVLSAAEDGAERAGQVFKSRGHRPKCGRCVNFMQEIIDGAENRTAISKSSLDS